MGIVLSMVLVAATAIALMAGDVFRHTAHVSPARISNPPLKGFQIPGVSTPERCQGR